MVTHIIVRLESRLNNINPELTLVKADAFDAELVDMTPHGTRLLFQRGRECSHAEKMLTKEQLDLSTIDLLEREMKYLLHQAVDDCFSRPRAL